jgi:membrane-associated protease RseP (regulator of RpoE activity)
MNKLLQKFALAGFTCLAFSMAYAQEPAPKGDKLGEYDEIIIKRNNNKDGKVTVEIKDGNVLVDGEKLESYKDGDISVYRRKIRPMDGNNFSFNMPQHGGMQFFGEGPDNNIRPGRALLGVLTEKKEAAGATVKEVSKESPAAKAGLQVGDVITKVDADKIEEPKELFEKIGAHEPGDKVTITYLRDKKENKATVTLDERPRPEFGFRGGRADNDVPEDFFRMMPPNGGGRFDFRGDDGDSRQHDFGRDNRRENNDAKLGLSVQDTEEGNGAVVLAVAPGSAAEKAGFKPNDIITSLAGTGINSTRDVTNAYRENKDKGTVDVQVKRDGKTQTLHVKVPKRLHKADL